MSTDDRAIMSRLRLVADMCGKSFQEAQDAFGLWRERRGEAVALEILAEKEAELGLDKEPYVVEFASKKRAGEIVRDRYATLQEAVRIAVIHFDGGKFPMVRKAGVDGFTAVIGCANKFSERPTISWSLSFIPNGIYKSVACRRAEHSGVNYRSHRRGYMASRRAMYAFAANWDAFTADRHATAA